MKVLAELCEASLREGLPNHCIPQPLLNHTGETVTQAGLKDIPNSLIRAIPSIITTTKLILLPQKRITSLINSARSKCIGLTVL